jgi:DNA-binding CsgD family transcriptional regulator
VSEAMHSGDLQAAAALNEEMEAIVPAVGSPRLAYAATALAAWRGDRAETTALIDAAVQEATIRGEGRMISFTEYAASVLHNGLGEYEAAFAAARDAIATNELIISPQALPELIEAAVRLDRREDALETAAQLSERARISQSDWALGIDARSRALMLGDDDAAEPLYLEAIERLICAGTTLHLARARLVYGEWLRARGRRLQARELLRTAHEGFDSRGSTAFAARAANELAAAGESTRRRANGDAGGLTPQEARIARLARDGLSNADIGAQLFISPRTVEYHLAKVFNKLAIESRRQLEHALSD